MDKDIEYAADLTKVEQLAAENEALKLMISGLKDEVRACNDQLFESKVECSYLSGVVAGMKCMSIVNCSKRR